MAQICYSWDDSPFAWSQTNFSWKECLVIQKVVDQRPKSVFSKKKEKYRPELTKEDEEVLIGLLLRINDEQVQFEGSEQKKRNLDITVDVDGIEISLEESKKVNLKIIL